MVFATTPQDRIVFLFKIDEHDGRCACEKADRRAGGSADEQTDIFRWTSLPAGVWVCERVGSVRGRVCWQMSILVGVSEGG